MPKNSITRNIWIIILDGRPGDHINGFDLHKPNPMNITAEIKQITGCTDKEAKKIHAYLLSYFGNLGAVSYSDLRREATHTSLLLKFCKN